MTKPNTAEEILDSIEDSKYLKGKPIAIKAMKKHTSQTLDRLREKVIDDIKSYGIPRECTHEDVMNTFHRLNPQEIGEIKAMLEFLNKIEEVSDE